MPANAVTVMKPGCLCRYGLCAFVLERLKDWVSDVDESHPNYNEVKAQAAALVVIGLLPAWWACHRWLLQELLPTSLKSDNAAFGGTVRGAAKSVGLNHTTLV
jgi:hypothetical protein